MDGYTAYGASITYRGSKQTFDCPAPKGVVADLDIIAAAPPAMNASGYADLIAKMPGRRRLDSGRLPGRRADQPVPVGRRAVASARVDAKSWRRPHGRLRNDSPPLDRADDDRLRDAVGPLEPPRLGRRASVQPPLGHGGSQARRPVAVARLQSRHRLAGVDRPLRSFRSAADRIARRQRRGRALARRDGERRRDRGALRARRAQAEGARRKPREARFTRCRAIAAADN